MPQSPRGAYLRPRLRKQHRADRAQDSRAHSPVTTRPPIGTVINALTSRGRHLWPSGARSNPAASPECLPPGSGLQKPLPRPSHGERFVRRRAVSNPGPAFQTAAVRKRAPLDHLGAAARCDARTTGPDRLRTHSWRASEDSFRGGGRASRRYQDRSSPFVRSEVSLCARPVFLLLSTSSSRLPETSFGADNARAD